MGRENSTKSAWISTAAAALALALAGCGTKDKPADYSAVQAKAAPAEPEGPVILTTIGHELDDKPLTDVRAQHGRFQLRMVDGIATLFVDGKTVSDGNAYGPFESSISSRSPLAVFDAQSLWAPDWQGRVLPSYIHHRRSAENQTRKGKQS